MVLSLIGIELMTQELQVNKEKLYLIYFKLYKLIISLNIIITKVICLSFMNNYTLVY